MWTLLREGVPLSLGSVEVLKLNGSSNNCAGKYSASTEESRRPARLARMTSNEKPDHSEEIDKLILKKYEVSSKLGKGVAFCILFHTLPGWDGIDMAIHIPANYYHLLQYRRTVSSGKLGTGRVDKL